MNQKRYLLRTTSGLATKDLPLYLAHVRCGGMATEWNCRPEQGRKFTHGQRVAFSARNPHIKGRWVLCRGAA